MRRSGVPFNPVAEIAGMPSDQITDGQLLDLHLRHMRFRELSAATIKARRGAVLRLRRHLDPDGQNPRALLDATAEQLVRWQAALAEATPLGKDPGCVLAAKSREIYVMHVQVYYDWLVRPMGRLRSSPAADLDRPSVKRRKPRPIPEQELAFALDACCDRVLHACLVLGAYAGLRVIDIVDLRHDDLLADGDLPALRVRGKGGHEEIVVVGTEVIEVLMPFTGRRGLLFPDPRTGGRRNEKQLDRAINVYLDRIGLPYTFHTLRHRYGTRVYEQTRDILLTQQQMRHKSLASTQQYVRVPTDRAAKAVEAFDAELSKRRRRT